MSEHNQNVVLVSASPKVDQTWAVSAFLAARGEPLLKGEGVSVETIPVRRVLMHRETDGAFASLQQADAIVLIFPLYFFCMPAMLTRFLQDFAAKYPKAEKETGVYAIVNCGFPEPEINEEAMRVVECFALQTGRTFLGGVMIGCGGMLMGTAQAPFMRPVFEKIDGLFARVKRDVFLQEWGNAKIEQTAPKFPKALYFIAGNAGWRSMARKNKLKSSELYRKPYQK